MVERTPVYRICRKVDARGSKTVGYFCALAYRVGTNRTWWKVDFGDGKIVNCNGGWTSHWTSGGRKLYESAREAWLSYAIHMAYRRADDRLPYPDRYEEYELFMGCMFDEAMKWGELKQELAAGLRDVVRVTW